MTNKDESNNIALSIEEQLNSLLKEDKISEQIAKLENENKKIAYMRMLPYILLLIGILVLSSLIYIKSLWFILIIIALILISISAFIKKHENYVIKVKPLQDLLINKIDKKNELLYFKYSVDHSLSQQLEYSNEQSKLLNTLITLLGIGTIIADNTRNLLQKDPVLFLIFMLALLIILMLSNYSVRNNKEIFKWRLLATTLNNMEWQDIKKKNESKENQNGNA